MKLEGLGGAVAGGAIGAGLWAGAAYGLNIESAGLAMVVGGLVGIGSVATGGRGSEAGLMSLGVTFAAILVGKCFGASLILERDTARDIYDALSPDVEPFGELNVRSDRQVRQFMYDYEYTDAPSPEEVLDDEMAWFREFAVPTLEYLETDPTFEEFQEQPTTKAYVRELTADVSLPEAVYWSLDHYDALFIALGLAAAYQICRASESLYEGV